MPLGRLSHPPGQASHHLGRSVADNQDHRMRCRLVRTAFAVQGLETVEDEILLHLEHLVKRERAEAEAVVVELLHDIQHFGYAVT